MKLLTKELSQILQKQYSFGARFEQMVICKFFDPLSGWTWYAMNQDPNDPDYIWGIVKGFEIEMGSFSLAELENIGRIERDYYFTPSPAQGIWENLKAGKHI